jgi:small-conductance mechanosensitive channel
MPDQTTMNFDLLPDSAWFPWVIASGSAVLLTLLFFGLRRLIVARLTRFAAHTRTTVDDLLLETIRRTHGWFLILLAVLLGSSSLMLSESAMQVRHAIAAVGIGLQAGWWLTTLVSGVLRLWMSGPSAQDGAAQTTLGALRFLVFLLVWSGILLLVLANLGVDVTALVAGLGVGGIAVALAVQNILGDLFASLSIVLDRPFSVGDFIIVEDFMGTVERVGLKTTRVRSLSGEQLIFSNANLLGTRIRNYQRMQERRIVFTVGVTYDTPPALVREIPGMIREAVTRQEHTRFDRANFKSFDDFALTFETVYFMLLPDFNLYMATQEQINLALLDQFGTAGIDFAFPTQTLYLARATGSRA